MASHILALLSYSVVDICQSEPFYADLNGGLDKVPDLPQVLSQIRKSINQTADIRRVLAKENVLRESGDFTEPDEL